MPRIAVTGHVGLTSDTIPLVERAIRERLAATARSDRPTRISDLERSDVDPLTGISCLAAGADTLFAQAVLDAGGRLEVVLPSADYRRTQVTAQQAPVFDALLARAARVHSPAFPTAGPAAYAAANRVMLDLADRLIAVWDGRPSTDLGGTADAVALARERGMPVDVLWPRGARRSVPV